MSNINPRTVSAVAKLAQEFGIQGKVYTNPGSPYLRIGHITMQRLDSGCWILACWNQDAGQYQSSDLTRQLRTSNPAIFLIVSRGLAGMESEVWLGNLRSYDSATAALKGALT
jgi:hypothetical protein